MEPTKLQEALNAVDWNANVNEFLTNHSLTEAVAQYNRRLAIWSKQLENADKGNPALSFIREMQVAGHYAAILASLALYKPAAAATRNVLETALYYTYFRTHLSELTTLVRNEDYFIHKSDIIEYHKLHTPNFKEFQSCFGLIGRLNKWYSRISSIIHGQIPGQWIQHKSIAEIKHKDENLQAVVNAFKEAEELVHNLLLCTVGVELWDSFSTTAKRQLISGLPGKTKDTLKLNSA